MAPTRDELVVLVTGTRTGLGRHLVEHFSKTGARVEGCSRKPHDFELPGYTHHQVDVTDEDAMKAMIAGIKRRHGRLDVLVNNAGIAAMNHALLTPTSAVERIFATNFTATFVACREAAKVMKQGGWGRIVNISSVAVPLRLEGESVYAASKAAVVELTQVLARELAPFGITCNAIGPSPIDTDLIRGVPKEKMDALVERLVPKRLGTFADVANVIDFFVRPESDAITGQVLYLGGV